MIEQEHGPKTVADPAYVMCLYAAPVHDDVRVDHVDVGHMAVSPLLGLVVGDEGRGVGVYVKVRWLVWGWHDEIFDVGRLCNNLPLALCSSPVLQPFVPSQ